MTTKLMKLTSYVPDWLHEAIREEVTIKDSSESQIVKESLIKLFGPAPNSSNSAK